MMHDPFRRTRRRFLELSSCAAASLFVPDSIVTRAAGADTPQKPAVTRSPNEILDFMLAGNKRFMRGETINPRRRPEDFTKLEEAQNPLAVVVGCSDSRVSPELLFDLGIGDLFVVRVAGNIINGAGTTVKGSIEYAVAELGVSLILVLGHSNCGAVKSALKHIEAHDSLPGAINEMVNNIKTAVARSNGQRGNALDNAIKANVEIGVERLKGLEPILAGRVNQGKLKVVGGIYDLRSGAARIFD
jgi:carbonic anhydrase